MTGQGKSPTELRIALVMTGGVSLAVWMGGVAYELDRLRRKVPPYDKLIDNAGVKPVIDVIVGTSAGGLNGTLLAAAIAWKTHFGLPDDPRGVDVRELWRTAGDFKTLLRKLGDPRPTSLLQGDSVFLVQVEDALKTLADSPPSDDHAARTEIGTDDLPLQLVATTTLMIGTTERYQDSLGQDVDVSTPLGQFHFVASDQRDDFDRQPGADRTASVERLAKAARSSASFPVAFEPSFVPVTTATSATGPSMKGIANFSHDRFVLDGGLVDNQPLQQALDLIELQPAVGPVRRVMLMVVPLAGAPDDQADQLPGAPPTLLEVADAAVAIPRNRDIAEQLQAMSVRRQHQDAISQFRATVFGVVPDAIDASASSMVRYVHPLAVTARRLGPVSQKFPRRNHASTSPQSQSKLEIKQALLNVQELLGRASRLFGPVEEAQDDAGPEGANLVDACRREVSKRLRELEGPERNEPESSDRWAVARALTVLWAAVGQRPAAEAEEAAQLRREVRCLEALARWHLADPSDDRPPESPPEIAHQPGADLSDDIVSALMAAMRDLDVLQAAATDGQVRTPQKIEFVQLSSDTPNCFDQRKTAAEKLTGVQLSHFGAFYLSSWRMNDWMWGRMDAAYRLTQLLLHEAADTGDPCHAARDAQLEILREELPSVRSAVVADQDDGAAATAVGAQFLAAPHVGPNSSEALVVEAFTACQIGTERLSGQVETPHFVQVATQAGAVGTRLLGRQPFTMFVRPALSGFRSLLVATNVLVAGSSKAKRVIALFVAAFAPPLLAVGLIGHTSWLEVAAGGALVVLVLSSVFNGIDVVSVLLGLVGSLVLLALGLVAIANGTSASRIIGVAAACAAGLLLAGMLLPTGRWSRRITAAVLILVVCGVTVTGVSLVRHRVPWLPNQWSSALASAKKDCAAPQATGPAHDCTTFVSGETTGAVTVALGLGTLIFLVVGVLALYTRSRRKPAPV